MFNAMYVQGAFFDVEGEQHAVITTACCAQSQEFIGEGFAEPMRIIGQSSGDEFDDRCRNLLWQLTESLQRRTGDFDLRWTLIVRCMTHLGGSPNSRRRSSPLTVLLSAMSRLACSRSSLIPG